MEDSKLVIERFDFNLGKNYLREILALAVDNFLELGGRIKVCPPAYAMGCETPSSVRSMVRKGWK
jgi:hypothetical protein